MLEENPTDTQKSMVVHASGLHRSKKSYRNYYCVGVSDTETVSDLRHLEKLGLFNEGHKINNETSQYFFLTDTGVEKAYEYKRDGIT